MDKEAGKRLAAQEAAKYVENGMILGLGTGSTAKHFVDILGERIAQGWALRGIPTSEQTRAQAASLGVEIIEPDETTIIDLAIDGADEVDPNLHLIKGGGGALLREKIVAQAAKKFIVIADRSKRVTALGKFPLPVEIEPFAWSLTVSALRKMLAAEGFDAPKLNLRAREGAVVKSDGGNLLLDCALGRIETPAALHEKLISLPGVVETGIFPNMTDLVIFGDEDGVSTQIR